MVIRRLTVVTFYSVYSVVTFFLKFIIECCLAWFYFILKLFCHFQDVGEGWWEGINSKGEKGLFPAGYVEVNFKVFNNYFYIW